jgi:fibro-slime domain-containing protein
MRSPTPAWLLLGLGSFSLLAGACARVASQTPLMEGSGGGGGSSHPGTDGGSRFDRGPSNIPMQCGDGMRTEDEACDDGNTVSGDGCSSDCRTVDPGYSCIPVGKPCHRVARCGDGVAVLPELCDDGNNKAGDGCSATCKVELGFKCSGSPSVCTPTKCGDKIVEGAESCDDGNTVPYDGCSADCQSEPNCTTGACVSRCGDGIVVGEACDDGNNLDGDGCSSTCQIEPGFMCNQPPLGASMQVPVVYRDFRYHNPTDFQPSALGQSTAVQGLVKTMLDADGKPVYTGVGGAYITAAGFPMWYRDTPGTNHTTTGKITLWNNGKGGFVNRSGPNGEQWPLTTTAYFCGSVADAKLDAAGQAIPCTFTFGNTDCDTDAAMPGYKMLQCITATNGGYSAIFQTALLDGNPLFFPVDADTFTPPTERNTATIGPPYSAQFVAETGTPLHNFSFTSEVRYWFQYDATKTYVLDFTGDDDVWLFINKKLAVDLGGIHSPVQGSVTIPPGAGTSMFGLADKSVYEVEVFQAERQTDGSSYRLTLSGFSAAPSECLPICGDGILGIGEECDDGVNAGGYGECGPGCKLGEFCGDGVVQPQFEDCDDGVNDGNPCPSGCRNLVIP